jgi:competence protein ComEC
MRLLNNNPFIKLVTVYVTGILLVTTWLHESPVRFLLAGVALILPLLPLTNQYLRHRQWVSALLLTGILLIGVVTTYRQHHVLTGFREGVFQGYARLVHFPEPATKRLKCRLELMRGTIDSVALVGQPHIVAYLPLNWKDTLLYPGTVFMLQTRIEKPSKQVNPHTFNYSRYLYHKGIKGQAFIRPEHVAKVPEASRVHLIHRLRLYCKQQIEHYMPDEESQGLLKALLLGFKKDLPEALEISYARAGAIHMLAVSGLHVGIFFLLIQHLLIKLGLRTHVRWLFYLMLLLALLMYAALTGFSPSVCRASLMFGCYTLGKWLHRDTQFYNVLAFSAFLLLFINPFILFDVGFQLSYAAVTSIVWLQPKIDALFHPKTSVGRFFWAVTTVSLAAQLGTFPISIFYFHQFPVYFLLSNWLAMLLIPVLLYAGIAFLVLSPFPMLASVLGKALSYVVGILNGGIIFIEQLPHATLTELYWSLPFFILIVGFVLSMLHGFVYRKAMAFLAAAVILLLVSIGQAFEKFEHYKKMELTLYNSKSPAVLSVIHKEQAWLLTPYKDSLPTDFAYSIKPHLGYSRVGNYRPIWLQETAIEKKGLFQLTDKRIAWIFDDSWRHLKAPQPLPVDYLILSGQTRMTPAQLLSLFSPDLVILHNSLVPWEIRDLSAYLKKEQINTHNIAEEGAWQWVTQLTKR